VGRGEDFSMAVLRIKALLKRLPKCLDLFKGEERVNGFSSTMELYLKTMDLEGGSSPGIMGSWR